ncbi:unnamed protein product [Caretta caretta]
MPISNSTDSSKFFQSGDNICCACLCTAFVLATWNHMQEKQLTCSFLTPSSGKEKEMQDGSSAAFRN